MAFKVMCINENWTSSKYQKDAFYPVFGKIYEVLETKWFAKGFYKINGLLNPASYYHRLKEFPKDLFYNSTHFATLPEDDSDKMKEETRESIVNIEQPITN